MTDLTNIAPDIEVRAPEPPRAAATSGASVAPEAAGSDQFVERDDAIKIAIRHALDRLRASDVLRESLDDDIDSDAIALACADRAAECRPDHATLAAVFLLAAEVIRRERKARELAEFSAKTNAETIKCMRAEHSKEIRELHREHRRESLDIAAEERWQASQGDDYGSY